MKIEELHDDDIPVGRVLTRKEMLGLLAGGAGSIMLASCGAAPTNTAQPVTATATQALATATSVPTTAASNTTAATTTVASTTAAATTTTASSATTAAATTANSATTAASSAASSATLPTCVVLPALTEGPYFVDEKLNRSDIRSDPSDGSVREGALLRLAFNVSQVGSGACAPLVGAYVDVWHCDALGVYSDVVDNGVGFNTKGKKFLRGYQVTDANGKVEFVTIYPGWYQGRAVHIHFKIRSSLGSTQTYTFTSQLFFDDTLSDQIYTLAPYSSKKGQRTTKNNNDGIYRQGGSQLLLKPTKAGNSYNATFNIGLQKG